MFPEELSERVFSVYIFDALIERHICQIVIYLRVQCAEWRTHTYI